MFLLQIYVLGNDNTHSDPHVKFPIFLPEFKQICIFSTDFDKSPQCQISRKSVHWEPRWYMRTDRRTDGHGEANRLFSRLCEKPKKSSSSGISVSRFVLRA